MGVLGFNGYTAFFVIYAALFPLSVTITAIYGKDLGHADDVGAHADSKWIFAVVVGVLSALSCIAYFIPGVVQRSGIIGVGWNIIMFILTIALFGVFGSLFIKEDPEGDDGIQRMKNMVWVDLVIALLWLCSAVGSVAYWWKHKDTRTRFTGRAYV